MHRMVRPAVENFSIRERQTFPHSKKKCVSPKLRKSDDFCSPSLVLFPILTGFDALLDSLSELTEGKKNPHTGITMKNLYKLFGIFSLVLIFTFFVKGDALAASPVAGNGSATIWWKTADGAASYNLYFREAGEKMFTHSVPNVPANAVNYTIKYLKPGVAYVYNLAAVDGSGKEYWWSGEKRFWAGSTTSTWSAVSPAPKAQANQQAQTSTPIAGWVSASAWIKPVSGASNYNVYYREAGQKGYWYSVPMVPSNAMSVKINYLKSGVTYYYNVAVVKDGKEWWQGEKVLVWGTPPVQPVQVVKLNKNMMIDNPSMGATPKSMPINQPKATGAGMMEKKAPSTPSGSTGSKGY